MRWPKWTRRPCARSSSPSLGSRSASCLPVSTTRRSARRRCRRSIRRRFATAARLQSRCSAPTLPPPCARTWTCWRAWPAPSAWSATSRGVMGSTNGSSNSANHSPVNLITGARARTWKPLPPTWPIIPRSSCPSRSGIIPVRAFSRWRWWPATKSRRSPNCAGSIPPSRCPRSRRTCCAPISTRSSCTASSTPTRIRATCC